MTQLILSGDQVETLKGARGAVELCDAQGNVLGYLSRLPSHKDVTESRQRLDSEGPWYTTEQVLNHLESLGQG